LFSSSSARAHKQVSSSSSGEFQISVEAQVLFHPTKRKKKELLLLLALSPVDAGKGQKDMPEPIKKKISVLDFSSPAFVGLGAPSNGDPTNKRIHVYFHHRGIFAFAPQQKDNIRTFLKAAWEQFGTVTDTFYHHEFSYGFISSSTHEEAATALSGLNDTQRLRQAIAAAVMSFPEGTARTEANRLADQLFVEQGGKLVMPSWASRRIR
jgi:hypothetical protein